MGACLSRLTPRLHNLLLLLPLLGVTEYSCKVPDCYAAHGRTRTLIAYALQNGDHWYTIVILNRHHRMMRPRTVQQ